MSKDIFQVEFSKRILIVCQSPDALTKPSPPPRGRFFFLCGCMLWAGQALYASGPLDRALDRQQQIQQQAVHSQQRIEGLDDESRRLLEEYRALQAQLDNLEKYNTQMGRMLAAQETEIDDLETQTREVEVTRRRILPLMLEMVDALEDFIAADTPFLARERGLRLSGLRELLDDPDSGLAEKYLRILEAYRIEADYAYSIEAYSGELESDGESRTVDYLRLGRTALYWLSLDRSRAGLWDPRTDRWITLDDNYPSAVDRAIRVARKQAPPELLQLPVPAVAPLP